MWINNTIVRVRGANGVAGLYSMIYILSLNLTMTLGVLLFLSILKNDAGRLVLGPLWRMLKIVAFCECIAKGKTRRV